MYECLPSGQEVRTLRAPQSYRSYFISTEAEQLHYTECPTAKQVKPAKFTLSKLQILRILFTAVSVLTHEESALRCITRWNLYRSKNWYQASIRSLQYRLWIHTGYLRNGDNHIWVFIYSILLYLFLPSSLHETMGTVLRKIFKPWK